MFCPQSTGRTAFKFPTNRQLRINDSCVTCELLAVPNCFDSNSKPCLIVMKDGDTTDLTVGYYAGLEAYLCNDLGAESIELTIYDYNRQSGLFSTKGDSGFTCPYAISKTLPVKYKAVREIKQGDG